MSMILAATLLLSPASATLTRVQTFETLRTVSIAPAPTGSRFAIGLESGDVQIRDAVARIAPISLAGHTQPAYALAYSRDGRWLATGDEAANIFLWDARTGRRLGEMPRDAAGHARGIQALAFSRDGRTLASVGKDDVIILWDVQERTPKLRVAGNGVVFTGIAATNSGWVASTLTEGLHFRKSATLELDARRPAHQDQGVTDLALASAGNRLVTAGRDGQISMWDTSRRLRLINLPAHADWVQRIAISPNGRFVATNSSDRTTKVWDLVTRQLVTTITDQSAVGGPLAISADGRYLFSTTTSDALQIHRIQTPSSPRRRR